MAYKSMNKLGREGMDRPYTGAFANIKPAPFQSRKTDRTREALYFDSLEPVLDALPLQDGMVVSFHHHMRNGDLVLNRVMAALADRGLKDLTLVASSLFPCHQPLVPLFEKGVVTRVYASYLSGPVARAVSEGKLKGLCTIQTHGGRPRMLQEGELEIDVAFIAAPYANRRGDLSGSGGPSACGVLGYAIADAQTAKQVVAITDHLADQVDQVEIPHYQVDYLVQVDRIGDPKGIVSGTTQITRDPVGLRIAKLCAQLIQATGYLKNGFTFQTGAGGISLAVAAEVRQLMKQQGIQGRFASGGITGYLVQMLEEGLFRHLYDVQCFELEAVRSIQRNENHVKVSADQYANPNRPDNLVNQLDVVILGASEIDLDYNVNVTTGSDGVILGGSGGHADTAAGAKLAIIVSKLVSSRISVLVDRVTTVTTPGETIDILVTDRGIAVHPRHQGLIEKLKRETVLPIKTIEELKEIADRLTGQGKKIMPKDRIVAVSQYRDGTILDVVRQV